MGFRKDKQLATTTKNNRLLKKNLGKLWCYSEKVTFFKLFLSIFWEVFPVSMGDLIEKNNVAKVFSTYLYGTDHSKRVKSPLS